MAQSEQWNEDLIVEWNEVVKAQEALVKESSSVGLHAALKARLVTLHYLLMQYEQLEDLLTPTRKEVIAEVKKRV